MDDVNLREGGFTAVDALRMRLNLLNTGDSLLQATIAFDLLELLQHAFGMKVLGVSL
jgi:hypothetical protein